MAKFSRTQIRLQQITGSFGNTSGKIREDLATVGTLAAIETVDLTGSLGHMASAIKRVVGGASGNAFTAVAQSTLKDINNKARISYADGAGILFGAEGDGSLAVQIGSATSADKQMTAKGKVVIEDATEALGLTMASLLVSGGIATAKDMHVGDDLKLVSDASVLSFGAGDDVTFTHDNGTGMDVDAAGAFDIQAGAASTINTAAGNLTIKSDVAKLILSGGTSAADAVEVLGKATFGSNVAITGDLTVNGTTTTVNSTTVTVDDPVFTLGGDSAPGSDDNKDRGIEFRYHDGSSARIGFFGFDDSTGRFTALGAATNTSEVFSGTKLTIEGGSLIADDLTAGHVLYAGASKEIKGEAGFQYDDANNILRTERYQVGGTAANAIAIGATAMVISSSTDVIVNSGRDIIFDLNAKANRAEFVVGQNPIGFIASGSAAGSFSMLLSSSDGRDIDLDSSSGNFHFARAASAADVLQLDLKTPNSAHFKKLAAGTATNYLEFDFSGDQLLASQNVRLNGDKEVQFNDANAAIRRGAGGGGHMLIQGTNSVVVSGAAGLEIGGKNTAAKESGILRLRERDANGSNYVQLRAPDVLASNIQLRLPNTDTGVAAGHQMIVTGLDSGEIQLGFEANAGALALSRVAVVTASIPANSARAFDNTVFDSAAPSTRSTLDLGSFTEAQVATLLDVYVNGQLLISGSSAQMASGAGDYFIEKGASATIKFGFDLEADDTVSVKVR